MRRIPFRFFRILFLAAILLFFGPATGRQDTDPQGQETNPQQIQKPPSDYMSNYITRNTRPLGLKDNPLVREMLNQSSSQWAVRAGVRHILD